MQITLEKRTFAIIQPQGHVNAATATALQSELIKAVSSQHNLLVDLDQVESLDSAGLMALVSTLCMAQKLDRRFSLCCLSPSIRIVFELTQLDRVFEIFETRADFEAAIA